MRLTLIQPCLGRRKGEPYVRTWQMEPLAPAVLAALTPAGVEVKFYDDRLEAVPFDEPTDLAAISVETYTAKRAYQIAGEYRKRGVPVVMGGFHATLATEEVGLYAEAVVVGQAEEVWREVVEDCRSGRLRRIYRGSARPSLAGITPDRSIFDGKRYLPIGLVEAGRGCRHRCEFCSIHPFYGGGQNWRPVREIIEEVRSIKKPLIYFVDDNIVSDGERSRELLRALVPLGIRWVSQASVTVTRDPGLMELLRISGCYGLLVGFESLDPHTLEKMGKGFNLGRSGYEDAVAEFRRHGIRLYATFVFGYGDDSPDTFRKTLDFAARNRFYLAAFNHLVPFPGTPLYRRLEGEGRLSYDRWWLDPGYRYGMLPFAPQGTSAEELKDRCFEARKSFFSFSSILRRSFHDLSGGSGFSRWFDFTSLNFLMRKEVLQRRDYPLGDESHTAELLPAAEEDIRDMPAHGAQPELREAAK